MNEANHLQHCSADLMIQLTGSSQCLVLFQSKQKTPESRNAIKHYKSISDKTDPCCLSTNTHSETSWTLFCQMDNRHSMAAVEDDFICREAQRELANIAAQAVSATGSGDVQAAAVAVQEAAAAVRRVLHRQRKEGRDTPPRSRLCVLM